LCLNTLQHINVLNIIKNDQDLQPILTNVLNLKFDTLFTTITLIGCLYNIDLIRNSYPLHWHIHHFFLLKSHHLKSYINKQQLIPLNSHLDDTTSSNFENCLIQSYEKTVIKLNTTCTILNLHTRNYKKTTQLFKNCSLPFIDCFLSLFNEDIHDIKVNNKLGYIDLGYQHFPTLCHCLNSCSKYVIFWIRSNNCCIHLLEYNNSNFHLLYRSQHIKITKHNLYFQWLDYLISRKFLNNFSYKILNFLSISL